MGAAKFHWSVCGPFRVQRRTSLVPSPMRPQGVRKNLVWDWGFVTDALTKKTCPSNWRCRHLDRCIACLTAGLWVYILKVRFIVYSLLQEVMHCTNWMSGPSPDILCTNGVHGSHAQISRAFGLFFACVCVWYLVSLATPFPERGLPATTELSPRNAIIEHSNKILISSFCRRGNLMVAAWPDLPLSAKVVAWETIWYHPELFVNMSSFTYLISALQFWRCQSMGSILYILGLFTAHQVIL